jgi:hypothetical protein
MVGELVAGGNTHLAKSLLQTTLFEEISSLVLFDADGAVILGTTVISKSDAFEVISIFNSRDEAMTNGIDFDGNHFDIHR